MKPIVSVIIPTYNRADFINEAIESVYAQTYRPIECIVVDDGSTDNTKTILEKWTQVSDNEFYFKYLYQCNSGAQVARNTGIESSTGSFIQFLDSDDLLYSDKLAKQILFLSNYKNYDAVFGDWEKGLPNDKLHIKAEPKHTNFLHQFLIGQPIAIFSMLMRKTIVEKIGAWDITIKRNQEIDFHLRGVLAGCKYAYQPMLCGLWRIHSGERIANVARLTDAIAFYRKWENELMQHQKWNTDLALGVVYNYFWFLNNYSGNNKREMAQVLQEIFRLYPRHPIFISPKFKWVKSLLGFNTAISLWINRFNKKRQNPNG